MYGRSEPQIHEVWTFSEDSVTREVHLATQEDVRSGFVREFATNYLTPSWHRVPVFGRNPINGRVKWLGVPDFLMTNGPPWTTYILAHCPSWGDQGSITNPNWDSQSGGGGLKQCFRFFCNRPVYFLPVYHWRIF